MASTPLQLLPVAAWRALETGLHASPAEWGAFAYVSLVSMFLGFFAWQRALAIGGIARIGSRSPLWSLLLLNERLTRGMAFAAGAVLASAALTRRLTVLRPT